MLFLGKRMVHWRYTFILQVFNNVTKDDLIMLIVEGIPLSENGTETELEAETKLKDKLLTFLRFQKMD